MNADHSKFSQQIIPQNELFMLMHEQECWFTKELEYWVCGQKKINVDFLLAKCVFRNPHGFEFITQN